ncbi:TPA: hypothetical protein N0F65_004733 [Lagenidium giganteum]|uniref:Uncharacterized protein n=1 Tax=Lagenidium giganteum TaxID=4803 RepID=A0AAV2YIE8_9STRA|nr:TPA: hypothetical protein N0F65_004733 [Lagenidium giganteum]
MDALRLIAVLGLVRTRWKRLTVSPSVMSDGNAAIIHVANLRDCIYSGGVKLGDDEPVGWSWVLDEQQAHQPLGEDVRCCAAAT